MEKMVLWEALDKLVQLVYKETWVPQVKMVLLVKWVKLEKKVCREYKEILVLQVKRE